MAHERARDARSSQEPALPRKSQNLTIPLGGLAPAHRERSAIVRAWRRYSAPALTVGGCAAAAAAVFLSIAPRPMAVFGDASSLHIGGATLQREASSPVSGYVAYSGAAAVLVAGEGAVTRTAGAATLGGLTATGWCAPTGSASADTDRCVYRWGGTRLTSVDTFDKHARAWRRTYSDGVTVLFAVPSGGRPVPIPLPLGR